MTEQIHKHRLKPQLAAKMCSHIIKTNPSYPYAQLWHFGLRDAYWEPDYISTDFGVIAQAIFFLEHRQTDTVSQTQINVLFTPVAIQQSQIKNRLPRPQCKQSQNTAYMSEVVYIHDKIAYYRKYHYWKLPLLLIKDFPVLLTTRYWYHHTRLTALWYHDYNHNILDKIGS